MSLAFMKQLRILMMGKKDYFKEKTPKQQKLNIWKNYFTHYWTEQQFNWAEHHWLHYYEKTNGPN